MKSFQLSEPTIFPDLNKKENQPADYSRNEIFLNSLKYKHFRSIIKIPEEEHMHHLLMMMTGLSDEDVGELSSTSAAELSSMVFQSMKSYIDLGQKIMRGIQTA